MPYGICDICGCTDNDCSQCIEASGKPCSWVDDEHLICSRCYIEACKSDLNEEQMQVVYAEIEKYNTSGLTIFIDDREIKDITELRVNTDEEIKEKKRSRIIIVAGFLTSGALVSGISKITEELIVIRAEAEKAKTATHKFNEVLKLSEDIIKGFGTKYSEQNLTPKAFGQSKMKIKKYK